MKAKKNNEHINSFKNKSLSCFNLFTPTAILFIFKENIIDFLYDALFLSTYKGKRLVYIGNLISLIKDKFNCLDKFLKKIKEDPIIIAST